MILLTFLDELEEEDFEKNQPISENEKKNFRTEREKENPRSEK